MNKKETYVRIMHGDTEEKFVVRVSYDDYGLAAELSSKQVSRIRQQALLDSLKVRIDRAKSRIAA